MRDERFISCLRPCTGADSCMEQESGIGIKGKTIDMNGRLYFPKWEHPFSFDSKKHFTFCSHFTHVKRILWWLNSLPLLPLFASFCLVLRFCCLCALLPNVIWSALNSYTIRVLISIKRKVVIRRIRFPFLQSALIAVDLPAFEILTLWIRRCRLFFYSYLSGK